jgi:hypothetical protein
MAVGHAYEGTRPSLGIFVATGRLGGEWNVGGSVNLISAAALDGWDLSATGHVQTMVCTGSASGQIRAASLGLLSVTGMLRDAEVSTEEQIGTLLTGAMDSVRISAGQTSSINVLMARGMAGVPHAVANVTLEAGSLGTVQLGQVAPSQGCHVSADHIRLLTATLGRVRLSESNLDEPGDIAADPEGLGLFDIDLW